MRGEPLSPTPTLMTDDSEQPDGAGQLDETARAVADDWAQSLDVDPTAGGSNFDPGASIRAADPEDLASLDLPEALQTLPRLNTERDGPQLPDLRDLGPIGEGGMAEIRSAIQVPIGREIATKQVKPSDELGTRHRQKQLYGLLREAWITGYLEHPNIVPIYRLGVDDNGDPAILMKRIEGVSWLELMGNPARHPSTTSDTDTSPLRDSLRESGILNIDIDETDPLRWHVETLIRVCHAIEFAHDRGILHRDLKPENVMLGEFGEVYVVDWGIAARFRPLDDTDDAFPADNRIPSVRDVNPSVGTPAFMAPEMIEGDVDRIGPASDVYLLGGILYNILTGRAPNRGDSIPEVLSNIRSKQAPTLPDNVPGPLADICRRAMRSAVEDRYQNVRSFRDALQDYVRHHESVSLSEESHQRLDRLERLVNQASENESHTGAPADQTADDARSADTDDRIRQLFAECRFGFEQALELSDSNTDARQGLQRSLELMVERELDRGGYEAAASYLADLPDPRPELRDRVEALGRELDARDQQYRQLQQFHHQFDVEVGRHARSLFVLAIGGLTAMLNIIPASWPSLTGHAPGPIVTLAIFAVYAAGVGALVFRARDSLMKNEANGKMIVSLFAILASDALFRIFQTGHGLERATAAPLKALMVGSCFNILAISLDLRLLWVGIPFIGIAGLQTFYPDHVLGLAAGGVIVGTLLLARAWWD